MLNENGVKVWLFFSDLHFCVHKNYTAKPTNGEDLSTPLISQGVHIACPPNMLELNLDQRPCLNCVDRELKSPKVLHQGKTLVEESC